MIIRTEFSLITNMRKNEEGGWSHFYRYFLIFLEKDIYLLPDIIEDETGEKKCYSKPYCIVKSRNWRSWHWHKLTLCCILLSTNWKPSIVILACDARRFLIRTKQRRFYAALWSKMQLLLNIYFLFNQDLLAMKFCLETLI